MKKIHVKTPTIVIRTREEMELLAGEIAELKNRQQLCSAQMDAGLKEIRERHAAELAGLETRIADKMEMARAWADANPGAFAEAKSLDLTHAVVGYRMGQPQLKTLPGWTWDRVLEKLKSLPWCEPLIRNREEVNKQQILTDRGEFGPERLRQIGVRVAQEEIFYVEPRVERVERREKLRAAA